MLLPFMFAVTRIVAIEMKMATYENPSAVRRDDKLAPPGPRRLAR